ncbi:Transcription initiation factor TFIID subunit 7 [Zea mays]|uniref:Transcription initiation factor TFIID subunit 7 n=1 Tax=Zea mays TaxID=4577 RepID=A0A1D6H1P4_MAIZE|nr:Transcription initiation factor TFIID subunit 7 [Zea mays]AQK68806.1 Transcription initiation factor TFIID subunit 7 [Zea mays]
MEEQFILRVPPSVAERIERLMNESAASSSNPDEASLDLSFSACTRQEAPSETAVHEFAARELRACRLLNGIKKSGQVQWGFQAPGTREAGNPWFMCGARLLVYYAIGVGIIDLAWISLLIAVGSLRNNSRSVTKYDSKQLNLFHVGHEDGRNGTFMIGNESFPASLLDLPAVVESYKTYDDSVLIKTADVGQMIMVREENDPAPEGVEYKHGLTPPMRDARRRRFRREPDLNLGKNVDQNASATGGEEGGDRKKPPVARAAKQPGVQEPAANGEEADPERSDSDDSDN